MKIVKKFREKVWATVEEFEPGQPIRMKAPVNQYCKNNDIYIIGTIPGCYLRDAKGPGFTDWILQDKLPVINLRTGGVSLVGPARECQRSNAFIEEN